MATVARISDVLVATVARRTVLSFQMGCRMNLRAVAVRDRIQLAYRRLVAVETGSIGRSLSSEHSL